MARTTHKNIETYENVYNNCYVTFETGIVGR